VDFARPAKPVQMNRQVQGTVSLSISDYVRLGGSGGGEGNPQEDILREFGRGK